MAFEISEEWLMEIGGWTLRKPALKLLSAGAVSEVRYDGKVLKATVSEGRRRRVAGLLINGRSDVTNLCNCPESRKIGAVCAHSFAAGLAYLADLETSATEEVGSSEVSNTRENNESRVGATRLKPVLGKDFYREIERGNLTVSFVGESVGIAVAGLSPAERVRGGLGHLLLQAGKERVPSSFAVRGKGVPSLFRAATGHPGIRVETESADGDASLRVVAEPGKLVCRMSRKGNHYSITLESEGRCISVGDESWWFARSGPNPLLMPLAVPIEFSALLSARKIEVPDKVLRRHAEAFFEAFDVSLDTDPGMVRDLWGQVGIPEVSLRLEGSLRALEASLEFRYPEGPVAQAGEETRRSAFPYRSGDVLFRRNRPLEKRALARLSESGWSQEGNSLILRDKSSILRFLLYSLRDLRGSGQWRIEIGPRLEHVMTKVQAVRPTVEWHDCGEGWLECGMVWEDEAGVPIPPAEIQRLARVAGSGNRKDGTTLVVDADELEDWNAALEEARIRQLGEGRFRVRKADAAFLEASMDRLGARRDSPMAPAGRLPDSFEIPPVVHSILREYQDEGVKWLAGQVLSFGGAVLGDEMGLGKTLQTLAFLSGVQSGHPGLNLVVCPASLLWNWEAEAKRFLPNFKIIVLHGTSRAKFFRNLNQFDLAITSYSLLVRDLEKWAQEKINAVVLDEASYIRNPTTRVAKAVHQLGSTVPLRLALTGTPIENSVRDLWSIMEFALPGHLGSRAEFRERYEKPLSQTGVSGGAAKVASRLRRRVAPFFLRRTKSEVAKDLPSKTESIRLVELGKRQAALYQGVLREASSTVAEGGSDPGARMKMLTALLRLRQICCDPRLIGQEGSGDGVASSKLELLHEILASAHENGSAVLVFSQFVGMLRLIRNDLDAAGQSYCYLDGASTDRAEQVETFQNDDSRRVFLISLKAGGYGLNLTRADTVVHFDPWWNPAVEAQATDRAHRIGQTRPVNVYKLVSRNTVEEKIIRLQRRKREVVDAALDDDQPLMQGLSDADLAELIG